MTRHPICRRLLIAVLIALCLCASPQAVGTLTLTTIRVGSGRVTKFSIAWVSDGSGNVSGNSAALSGIYVGYLEQIKFVPDGGGTAPTALYDVTLVDANGNDLLAGAGADLSATASKIVHPATPFFIDGTAGMALDLVVANAGASKGGTVNIWISATPQ